MDRTEERLTQIECKQHKIQGFVEDLQARFTHFEKRIQRMESTLNHIQESIDDFHTQSNHLLAVVVLAAAYFLMQ